MATIIISVVVLLSLIVGTLILILLNGNLKDDREYQYEMEALMACKKGKGGKKR